VYSSLFEIEVVVLRQLLEFFAERLVLHGVTLLHSNASALINPSLITNVLIIVDCFVERM